jgi:hypothetical protein
MLPIFWAVARRIGSSALGVVDAEDLGVVVPGLKLALGDACDDGAKWLKADSRSAEGVCVIARG